MLPLFAIAQVRKAIPTCLRLLIQAMRCALDLLPVTADSEKIDNNATMAITTINSTRVKALACLRMLFILMNSR